MATNQNQNQITSQVKFRLISDTHEEFGELVLPELPTDSDSVLLLAGDIHLAGKYNKWFDSLKVYSDQFKYVFYVLGNHEYYDSNFKSVGKSVREMMSTLPNVFVLDNEVNYVDNIAIIGATLWTDFDDCDPILMQRVADRYLGLSDYQCIRRGTPSADPWNRDGEISYSKITPNFILGKHTESRDYIFNQIKKEKEAGRKVVVMSHHGPTWKSVGEGYVSNGLNGAYVSDLSNEILDTKPDIWVHGHVHSSADYFVGDTQVLCNPRGYYPSELNQKFNPTLTFDLCVD